MGSEMCIRDRPKTPGQRATPRESNPELHAQSAREPHQGVAQLPDPCGEIWSPPRAGLGPLEWESNPKLHGASRMGIEPKTPGQRATPRESNPELHAQSAREPHQGVAQLPDPCGVPDDVPGLRTVADRKCNFLATRESFVAIFRVLKTSEASPCDCSKIRYQMQFFIFLVNTKKEKKKKNVFLASC